MSYKVLSPVYLVGDGTPIRENIVIKSAEQLEREINETGGKVVGMNQYHIIIEVE